MNKYIAYLLLCSMLWFSCNEIFEEDIEDDEVILFSPDDSLTTNTSEVKFWWGFVDGAEQYNLQVVSPTFDEPEKMILDTIVSTNTFTTSLPSGKFQWAVSASNNGYSTLFYQRTFWVDTVQSSKTISLQKPQDKSYTNSFPIIATWDTDYRFDQFMVKVINENTKKEYYKNTSDLHVTFPFSGNEEVAQGWYSWKIIGFSGNELSESETFTFFSDTIKPNQATIKTPQNNAVIKDGEKVIFKWDASSDNGSPISHVIYYTTKSDFSEMDSIANVEIDSAAISLPINKYFWKMLSVDKAGNRSESSSQMTFEVLK